MPAFAIHPLTPDRWGDLVALFGPERGANSGCWCMWWRMGASEWKTAPRAGRRERFRAIVEGGPPPGVLAYEGASPIGWCAVGPRKTLPRMNKSRVAAPLDGVDGVFGVSCFYIRPDYRRTGLMRILLDGAIAFAAASGADALEACPIDTGRKLVWGEGFVGLAPVFRAAGFSEVARRSPTRPLMRLSLSSQAA
jgi:GNAT superfamily N-acetyltransferase